MQGSREISPTAYRLVKGVDKLVSLPEVCFLVNDLVNDPLSDIEEIGHVISQDPDLTARLLKLVNSSFYGFPQRIETVSRAILMVGLKELQNMVWATSAVETFSKLPPKQVNMASFWRHSIFTAVVGRILARECNILHPERLFVAGLLHEIGRLLFYTKLPKQSMRILKAEEETPERNPILIEREIVGMDHAEVAAALLEQWFLPDSLIEAVRFHHSPALAQEYVLESSILHIANAMAHALESGEEDALKDNCDSTAWNLLNIPEARVKRILHEAVLQFLEALELLLPGASQKV
ncbi:MAG: HDOD domain-containing protein [Gammaproteobacteria bacterium]|nr:HDOD domain-containing protein [Gammaproteobacteria bacterium]